MDADQILVLNHGRIVERGSHMQLSELKEEYARMWALQQEQAQASAEQVLARAATPTRRKRDSDGGDAAARQ